MKTFLYSILLPSLILVSCASISDAIKAKDDGTVVTYPVDFEQGWKVALRVLRWEDAETIEQHKDENYMVTTIGQNLISAGSVIAVWVEPQGNNSVKVTCVTKRKMQTNIATGLTETTFHRRFKQAVDIVKQGKELPHDPPK
ncbi:MAG: hypothetical protein KF749_08010 [Bacteroidetes bacterium]|nr:hypothetical protein [Bacteroidota bacterium]MCW5894915.1 hypothetical protein [Bacteroidota bacterium]